MYDLLITGGGINGTGIARDAAGRGLRVCLVEQDDLASHTSSASTKLIHGGLRYLEFYEFRLVREALAERARLLAIAPHIVWPLRFVLPLGAGSRPAWLIRAGLFLYDHIGGRGPLPATRTVELNGCGLGAGLKAGLGRGFAYSDCWVEDSRLVVLNAVDAAARGAAIRTRTRLVSARREGEAWRAEVHDTVTGAIETLAARRLVNAAGPWVAQVLAGALGQNAGARIRMVKGSHIVVRRLYEGEHAFLLQNADGRIVFVIPYEQAFSLVGTTDLAWEGDPGRPEISPAEIDYLCEATKAWLATPIGPADIVSSFSGIRPLYDDGAESASEVTRDYVLELDQPEGQAPCLSVYGGKITTYRRLAEAALAKLGVGGRSWTAGSPLPGGDMRDFDMFLADFAAAHPFLPASVARRLARAYGTRASSIIGTAKDMAALGDDFGHGLTEAEIAYLVTHEFARTPEDVLWRRSKLGLHLPPDTAGRLAGVAGLS